MPKIDTLVSDIQDLIHGRKPLTEDFESIMIEMSRDFGSGLAKRLVETRDAYLSSLSSQERPGEGEHSSRPFRLRVSNHGKPLRQLWYESRGYPSSPFPPNIAIIGDMIEVLALGLARAAGHEVTLQQAEVEVGGIVGHIDAVIDGELVDVKSTSDFGMKKFDAGLDEDNDVYGYRRQLSAYAASQGRDQAYFLVVGKSQLDMKLIKQETLQDVEYHIHLVQEALDSDVPPERCFPDVEKTKAGNRALCSTCKFCDYKFECWKESNGGKGLRVFDYTRGPEFFTEVVEQPTRQVKGKGKEEIPEITERFNG